MSAQILHHDRHNRNGRSERHYYVVLSGQAEEDGAW